MKHDFLHILMDWAHGTKHRLPKSKMSAKESFLLTEKELRRLNTIVNHNKLSDKHIADSIFVKLKGEISEWEIEHFAKSHFAAAYYSFLDIKEKMIKEKCFDYRGIKKYGYLINLILFDSLIFANHLGQKIDPQYLLFQGGNQISKIRDGII